jgi:hypothetical protein
LANIDKSVAQIVVLNDFFFFCRSAEKIKTQPALTKAVSRHDLCTKLSTGRNTKSGAEFGQIA